VLGAVLLSAHALEPLLTEVGLAPLDFYRERHRLIFAACVRLHDRGRDGDPLDGDEELSRTGELEEAGGTAYVHSLPNLVPSAANFRSLRGDRRRARVWRDRLDAARRWDASHLEDEEAFAEAEQGACRRERPGERTFSPRSWRTSSPTSSSDQSGEVFPFPWTKLNELARAGCAAAA
jgi:replicative DNA helicase